MRAWAAAVLAVAMAGCGGGPMTISEALEVNAVAARPDRRCAPMPAWVAAEAARPADPSNLAGSEARKARALNAALAHVRSCRGKT